MNSIEDIRNAFQASYDGLNTYRGGWQNASAEYRKMHSETLTQIAMGLVIANFWRNESMQLYASKQPDRQIIMCLQIGYLISEHEGDSDAGALADKVYKVMTNQGIMDR